MTFKLNGDYACALGVLINLRQAILSAVTLDGAVLFSEEVPLPENAPAEETAEKLSARILTLAEENGIRRRNVVGLGLAVRGITSEDGSGEWGAGGGMCPTDEGFLQETKIMIVVTAYHMGTSIDVLHI